MFPFPKSLLLIFSVVSILLISLPSRAQEGVPCNRSFNKKVEKLYDEGIGYYKKGNYAEALKIMRKLTTDEPEFTDAWFVTGMIYFKRYNSNFKEAEKNFRKVISLCPSYDPYVYFYLGEICYSSDRFDSTITYLTEFTKDVEKIKSDQDYDRAMELLNYSIRYVEMINKPVPFEPRVVEGISTVENEYLPIISADNQMALYTREIKLLPDKNSVFTTTKSVEKFMFSSATADGNFSEGEEMPDPFNRTDNEGGAALTIDNNTLFYTVCKYTKNNTYYNCDLYASENIGGEWGPIRPVSDKINQSTTWESQPTISPDGKTLYFVSDRPGGSGEYDIYKSIKNEKNEWSYPVNLGPTINSKGNEKSPFLHPDGKTLYFSSDGWLGLGGFDIFFSRIDEQGKWSKPKNIGYPINSTEDEVSFFVSTDGTHAFFASNKLQGKGGWDLYTFELYQEARPDKVLFIKGTVKSESEAEPVKARIELKNLETKKISEIPLDSLTGNYVAVAPFATDYVMTVKKEGYVYETKYISKIDSVFKTPATIDLQIQPIEINKSYRINDIYFGFNKFELSDESKAVIDQLTEFLTENPKIKIQVQGHTDNIGNDADNVKLSENRARSVFDYLVSKGLSKERITYKGFGKSMPVASNETEEGRGKNRRTVFVIIEK
jgi:outer membrane protein OmpA-like peptidoglycan-associated protein/tetratricopeptide (TPR) repeat protein